MYLNLKKVKFYNFRRCQKFSSL